LTHTLNTGHVPVLFFQPDAYVPVTHSVYLIAGHAHRRYPFVMPKFAANLTMLYPEVPFLERFALAAADGFKGVECLFPYDFPPQILRARLDACGLVQVLFNAPPGNWAKNERGIACHPRRQDEFRASIEQALVYAEVLDCPNIHVMAGIPPADVDASRVRDTYVQNLAWVADAMKKAGRTALIEPINTRDVPGYFLNHQAKAHAIVRAIGSPHLKVQMDLYHVQIVEGDVATKVAHYLPSGQVGHFQLAGVPERHEPDVGEMNYPYLFALIDRLGYTGWIGCEYRPARGAVAQGTRDGLGWFAPYKA
jgi:2-dehydrotetronate isomerase